MKTKLISFGLALGMAASVAIAKETPKPVQQHNSNAVWFENWTGLSNTSMIIQAPDGAVTTIFAKSGTPVFQLNGDQIQDGIYRYELSAATENTVKIVNKQNNGRGDASKDSLAEAYRLNGHFTVYRGVIVTPKDVKEE
ncbi:hypothetical protein [Ascidiaceihabitans sp.]|uniref:hypothetical protein n=1 Tax=Ascidiaceihabitans sp. TaxID=1872644 RepID=UPI003296E5DB